MELVKLPDILLTLYGIQHGVMVPLVNLKIEDTINIDKALETTLSLLADNSACILHDTLVFTEKYDAFTIKVNKGTNNAYN